MQEIFKDVIGPDGKPMVVRQLVITQPLQSLAVGHGDNGNSSQQVLQNNLSEANCSTSAVTSESASTNDMVVLELQDSNVNNAYSVGEDDNSVDSAVFLCQTTDAKISSESFKRLEALAYGDENSKDVWLGYDEQATQLGTSPSVSTYALTHQNLSTVTSVSGNHTQSSGEKKLTTDHTMNQGPVLLKTDNASDWVHNVCSPDFHVPEDFLKTGGGCPTHGVVRGQLHSPGFNLVASSPNLFEGIALGDMLPMEVTLLPFACSPPPEFTITNVTSLGTPTMSIAVSPSNSDMTL